LPYISSEWQYYSTERRTSHNIASGTYEWAEVVEATDIEEEIEMNSGYASCPYRHRGVDLEVVNCDDSKERVAALAPSLET
jgi:hypothetical protein